jgi:hypothetical protein
MRVISMVPSWTETLLEAGIEVVGRTEFCVHPADRVSEIPVVGGTKRVDWDKVARLDADLLLLDKEENPRSMADRSPIPVLATHVRSVGDLPRQLVELTGRVAHGHPPLLALAERWQRIVARPVPAPRGLDEIPGVIEWFQRPTTAVRRFVYLVWRDPWMAVGPGTFIGSVFAHLGFGDAHLRQARPYPVVDLDGLDPQRTLLLFSTEPYPFARHRGLMAGCGFPAALVDGEAYSWFGLRTLRFLEGTVPAQ